MERPSTCTDSSSSQDKVATNRDHVISVSSQQTDVNLGEIPKRIITEEDNLSVCRVNNASFEGGNCIKINAARNQTGFFVDGLIQCTALTWKVDTGAKKTFITEEVFYEIPQRTDQY